jgi:hypothetical protein
VVTGGAHDTLRDDLAEALWRHWADADNEHEADWSIVPDDEKHTWRGYADVALRYADAQVAADRERIAAEIEACIPRERDRDGGGLTALLLHLASIARGQP